MKRSSSSDATSVEPKRLTNKLRVHISETVKKLSKIVPTIAKSRMIHFIMIILLSMNSVNNMGIDFPVQQGDFEYVVFIQVSNVHLCTGTIIHETYVLTIAHVLIGEYKFDLSIVAGMSGKIHPSDYKFPVKEVYLHRQLKRLDTPGKSVEDYWENNIAIIKLAEEFILYEPARLTTTQLASLPCLDCVMISWMYPQREHKELLAKTWDFVYSRNDEDCHEQDISVLKNQGCFSNIVKNSLITSNHLGSPIVCMNFLVGFVAKGTEDKMEGTPSTFLKTPAYTDFILEIVNEGLVDVSPEEVPYIVSIWHNSSFICGGSVLDAIHILTTANCVAGFELARLKIIAGYLQLSVEFDVRLGLPVHDIIFHENYTEHDIAVLVLKEPVPFPLTWHTLDYENTKNFSSGQWCSSFHWKYLQGSIEVEAIQLKKSLVGILTKEVCAAILESQEMTLTTPQFCARNTYHIKIADHKDRGNPVISEGKPVGILVRTFPLDDHSPTAAVFLSLYPYIEFIRSAMNRS